MAPRRTSPPACRPLFLDWVIGHVGHSAALLADPGSVREFPRIAQPSSTPRSTGLAAAELAALSRLDPVPDRLPERRREQSAQQRDCRAADDRSHHDSERARGVQPLTPALSWPRRAGTVASPGLPGPPGASLDPHVHDDQRDPPGEYLLGAHSRRLELHHTLLYLDARLLFEERADRDRGGGLDRRQQPDSGTFPGGPTFDRAGPGRVCADQFQPGLGGIRLRVYSRDHRQDRYDGLR